jgi:hypothetical protein
MARAYEGAIISFISLHSCFYENSLYEQKMAMQNDRRVPS